MDLVSDVLRQAGLQRRLLDLRHLPATTALRFPCERSMDFHVVTQGRVWVHALGAAEPLAWTAGDVAFMARGCVHVLAPVTHPCTPRSWPHGRNAPAVAGRCGPRLHLVGSQRRGR